MKFDKNLEQRLEKKLNDVNCLKNSVSNIEGTNTYFRDKNHESKKKNKKYRILTIILKSFDTFNNIGTKAGCITLSFAGVGLIALPMSSGNKSGLTISNKVISDTVIQNYNKHEKE